MYVNEIICIIYLSMSFRERNAQDLMQRTHDCIEITVYSITDVKRICIFMRTV